MLKDLSSLFDREFAVGHFLPAGVFLLFNFLVLSTRPITIYNKPEVDIVITTTLGTFIAWFTGVLLYALNWRILKFLEGYGKLNPLKLLRGRQVKHFTILLTDLQNAKEKAKDNLTDDSCFKIEMSLADNFPQKESEILPTRFGNAIKAFEAYPGAMYGLEGIASWNRLQFLVPERATKLINASKAQLDFWVNLMIVFFILSLESFILNNLTIASFGYVLAGFLCYCSAVDAAKEWGRDVKAAFDVYAAALKKSVGIPSQGCFKSEFWDAYSYSSAVIRRRPEFLPAFRYNSEKNPGENNP